MAETKNSPTGLVLGRRSLQATVAFLRLPQEEQARHGQVTLDLKHNGRSLIRAGVFRHDLSEPLFVEPPCAAVDLSFVLVTFGSARTVGTT